MVLWGRLGWDGGRGAGRDSRRLEARIGTKSGARKHLSMQWTETGRAMAHSNVPRQKRESTGEPVGETRDARQVAFGVSQEQEPARQGQYKQAVDN